MSSQLKKGVLDMCVLALLTMKNNYAYNLVAELADHLGVSEGTIYPLMRRLQTEGHVSSYLVDVPGSPPRRYYKPTPEGKQELARMCAEWCEFSTAVNDILKEAGA